MDTNWDKLQGSDTYKQLMQVEIIVHDDYVELQHNINSWIKNHACTCDVTNIVISTYEPQVIGCTNCFIGTINYTTAVKIQ